MKSRTLATIALSAFSAATLPSAAHAQLKPFPVIEDAKTKTVTKAIPGDSFEPKAIPGDSFEPKAIPGDSFDPQKIPGDSFEPKAIPGDSFDPKKIPGDSFETEATLAEPTKAPTPR